MDMIEGGKVDVMTSIYDTLYKKGPGLWAMGSDEGKILRVRPLGGHTWAYEAEVGSWGHDMKIFYPEPR